VGEQDRLGQLRRSIHRQRFAQRALECVGLHARFGAARAFLAMLRKIHLFTLWIYCEPATEFKTVHE
jgi:hypothetical protein